MWPVEAADLVKAGLALTEQPGIGPSLARRMLQWLDSPPKREGLKADWNRVFAEAAKLDKAVEVDGYADRQDLRVSLLKKARKEGCRISLGTDAHAPSQLAYMELSLAAAYLAKIPVERILNFMPVDQLLKWVQSIREG